MWNVQRDYLGAWPSGRSSVLEQGSLAGDTLGPVNAIQGIECGFGAGHTRQIGALAWAADQVRILPLGSTDVPLINQHLLVVR
jgi:hypothetical protein